MDLADCILRDSDIVGNQLRQLELFLEVGDGVQEGVDNSLKGVVGLEKVVRGVGRYNYELHVHLVPDLTYPLQGLRWDGQC